MQNVKNVKKVPGWGHYVPHTQFKSPNKALIFDTSKNNILIFSQVR